MNFPTHQNLDWEKIIAEISPVSRKAIHKHLYTQNTFLIDKNVSQRWNEENLIEEMNAQSLMMRDNDVHITNLDFEPVIRDESQSALLYLDPPYFEKGKGPLST